MTYLGIYVPYNMYIGPICLHLYFPLLLCNFNREKKVYLDTKCMIYISNKFPPQKKNKN